MNLFVRKKRPPEIETSLVEALANLAVSEGHFKELNTGILDSELQKASAEGKNLMSEIVSAGIQGKKKTALSRKAESVSRI